MAEVGAFTPEVYPIAPPKTGPMEVAWRKVLDFVKSQRPSEHARRAMEKVDWVGDQLDGTSRELYEKLRPAAEKAAKVAGVVTTTMEVVLALEVAVGASLLLGTKGGREALGGLTKTLSEKHPNVRDRVTKIVMDARQSAGAAKNTLGKLFGAIGDRFQAKAPDIIAGSAATAVATAAVTGAGAVIRPRPEGQPAPTDQEVNIVETVRRQQADKIRAFAQKALQEKEANLQQPPGTPHEAVVRSPKNDSHVMVVRENISTRDVTIQHIDLLRRKIRTIVVPFTLKGPMSGSLQTYSEKSWGAMRPDLENGIIRNLQDNESIETSPLLAGVDIPIVLKLIDEIEAVPIATNVAPAGS